VPQVRFADIAGLGTVLEEIKNVVQLPLTHADYFTALGVEPHGGVLLYGPPGNGKTLLAKAVACESQAHFELVNGPEVLSPFIGQSEINLRLLFERARELAPSVILLDELDSLAPRRNLVSHHHHVQLLSQLLVLLDGLEARGKVAVLGTTNRLEALDPALCRPGRFDYHLEVPLPDQAGRAAILAVHLGKMRGGKAICPQALSRATEGFSGAELASLCREAGLQAIQRSLAKGLPPRFVYLRLRDVQQALAALRAKRLLP
jgi:transitional endoplasmic reticulum ATPase